MTKRALLPADACPLGVPVVFSIPETPRRSLIIVVTADGLRGYWNVCRHLPIPLDGGAGTLPAGPELVCISHGAAYRFEDGLCVRGPCVGKALESVPLWVEAGTIYAEL